jgi:hypothetical protein
VGAGRIGWNRQETGLRFADGDDLETANEIGGAAGFGKAGVAVRGGQSQPRHVAGDIKDTGPAHGRKLGCEFRSESAVKSALHSEIFFNSSGQSLICRRQNTPELMIDAIYMASRGWSVIAPFASFRTS